MSTGDDNSLITRVIRHHMSRAIFLDYEDQDLEEKMLTTNSLLVDSKGNVGGSFRTIKFSTIEVYDRLEHFPPNLLQQLLCQVIPKGRVMVLDTPENRKQISKIGIENIDNNFAIRISDENFINGRDSSLFRFIHRSDTAIFERSRYTDKNTYRKLSERFVKPPMVLIFIKTTDAKMLSSSKSLIQQIFGPDSVTNSDEDESGIDDPSDTDDSDVEIEKLLTKKKLSKKRSAPTKSASIEKETAEIIPRKETSKRAKIEVEKEGLTKNKENDTDLKFLKKRLRIEAGDKVIDLTEDHEDELNGTLLQCCEKMRRFSPDQIFGFDFILRGRMGQIVKFSQVTSFFIPF